jgi:hypothetical protein
MMEILESFDKLMNRLDEKNYSRLLGNLAWIIYSLDTDGDVAKLTVLNSDAPYSEEEKAIIQYFIENPNIRPGVLASCYSRVIVANFKVHYSV